jgi:16S rRNA (cytosine967-C5)-methyltransferase
VCSLEHAEGAGQAARIGLDPWSITADELPVPGIAPTPEGWLRTDPAMLPGEGADGGMDGFFVGRWRA